MNLVRIGSFDSYESLAMANQLATQLLKHGLDTRIISMEQGSEIGSLFEGLEAERFDLVIWKKSQLKSLPKGIFKLGSQVFEYKDEALIVETLCSDKLRESSKKEIKEILDQLSPDHNTQN